MICMTLYVLDNDTVILNNDAMVRYIHNSPVNSHVIVAISHKHNSSCVVRCNVHSTVDTRVCICMYLLHHYIPASEFKMFTLMFLTKFADINPLLLSSSLSSRLALLLHLEDPPFYLVEERQRKSILLGHFSQHYSGAKR